MLKSLTNYYYNRYRASQLQPIRALLDLQFTLGSNTGIGQTQDKEQKVLTLANELADMGYAIDVPIMVTGLNPQTQMVIRENQGFTWIPSGRMANIPVMPGLSFPGSPSYDPNAYPKGSIKVITNPDKFIPASDMNYHDGEGEGSLPYVPISWLAYHSLDYDNGLSQDPNGVGSLYSLNYRDRTDVGCWYSATIGQGKNKVNVKYEKVAYAGNNGNLIIQWELIEKG